MIWRSIAVACMALAALGTGLPRAFATQEGEDTATLTIHYRECEEVPADGNWYGTCHDNPYPGATLGVINEETLERTAVEGDDSGNLTYTLPPGTYRLDGPPGHALDGSELFCSASDTPGTEVPHPVSLGAGESVTCDLYIVQSCLAADPDVCEESTTTEPPPPEPTVPGDANPGDTGIEPTPSAAELQDADRLTTISAGTCDDTGDALTDVSILEAPIGEPAGAADAVPAATAFFVVDLSLDDLLADDHVVVVLAPAADANAVTACGPIGGVVAPDGSLAIGLRGELRFGDAGIAYLAPDDAGTAVTVFLAADLADDAGTPDTD